MKTEYERNRERVILKAVFLLSLIVLVVLGSTILAARFLRNAPPSNGTSGKGWQSTPEIRIVMDSTADWARMMFNDLFGGNSNGIRVAEFHSYGWLLGNSSDDRIDAGRSLTFIDIVYNATVVKTGDIVGFFKGNNDFTHTKMYVDVVLEVNTDMRQVSVFLMVAGAGVTTFQITNKQSGTALWQDTETGNSFTQYLRRSMSSEVFFAKERIDEILVLTLVAGIVVAVVVLNTPRARTKTRTSLKEYGGL